MTKRFIFATASLLAFTSAAHAQGLGAGESCAAYAGWADRAEMKAAPGVYDVAFARLELGVPAEASLLPIDAVAFVAEPERYPDPGVYGGLIGFTAPVAGTYRVSIGMGAWLDVVNADEELVPSGAFGHGPGCEGVGKMVEFDLQPGDYVIQVSGNPEPGIGIMVSRRN